MFKTPFRAYLALFICAFLVRLYFLSHSFFLYDESKFFAVIRDLVEGLYFPRLGPPMTVEGAYIPGGFFFYFMSISQVFGASVIHAYLFMSLCASVGILFFFDFIKIKWGIGAAWVSSLFLCFSPWMIFYNITLWNPNLIYLFLSLSFWLLVQLELQWKKTYFICLVVILGLFPQIHLSAVAFWVGFLFISWPLIKKAPKKELKNALFWILALLIILYLPYITIEIKMRFANSGKVLFGVAGQNHSWSALYFPLYIFRFFAQDLSYFYLQGFHQALPEWKALFLFLNSGSSVFWKGIFAVSLAFTLYLFAESVRRLFCFKNRWMTGFFLFILIHFILLLVSKKQIFPHYFNGLILICACFLGIVFSQIQKTHLKYMYLVFYLAFILFGLKEAVKVSENIFSSQSLGVKQKIVEKLIERMELEEGPPLGSYLSLPISVGLLKSEKEPGFFMQTQDQSLNILAERVYKKRLDFKANEHHKYNLVFIQVKTLEEDPAFLSKFNVLETVFSNPQLKVLFVK